MKVFLEGNRVVLELDDGERLARRQGGIVMKRDGDYFTLTDNQFSEKSWQRLWSDITDESGSAQADADATETYLEQNLSA